MIVLLAQNNEFKHLLYIWKPADQRSLTTILFRFRLCYLVMQICLAGLRILELLLNML